MFLQKREWENLGEKIIDRAKSSGGYMGDVPGFAPPRGRNFFAHASTKPPPRGRSTSSSRRIIPYDPSGRGGSSSLLQSLESRVLVEAGGDVRTLGRPGANDLLEDSPGRFGAEVFASSAPPVSSPESDESTSAQSGDYWRASSKFFFSGAARRRELGGTAIEPQLPTRG